MSYYEVLGRLSGVARRLERLESERMSLTSRIRWYVEEAERLRAELKATMEKIHAEEAERERLREELKKIPKPPPPAKFWRVQKAREYFAKEPGKETPVPFAEYRCWVFTQEPEKWLESRLAEELRSLEYIASLHGGRTHIAWSKAVFDEQSFECEPVDADEVTAPLDEIQYNVKWWHKPHRGGEIEYGHEKVMACIRRTLPRIKAPEKIRQLSLEDWAKKERPPKKLVPRRRRP